jgi:hypothetical protein
MNSNSGGKSKKAENTGAVLAVLLGLLCLMAAGLAFADWRYYAAIQRDPVTVTGVLTDIGKDGISYEYAFEGNRFAMSCVHPRRSRSLGGQASALT